MRFLASTHADKILSNFSGQLCPIYVSLYRGRTALTMDLQPTTDGESANFHFELFVFLAQYVA